MSNNELLDFISHAPDYGELVISFLHNPILFNLII